MSDKISPSTGGNDSNLATTVSETKGKGKSFPQDVSMEEDEDSSDEETGAEEEVGAL